LPVFAPRKDRVGAAGDRLHASFLGHTVPLATPVDWAAASLVELQAMNLHYMEYLEAIDDDTFGRVVADWIEQNPVGRPGSWRIAWNSFVVSLRTVVWMQQLSRRGRQLPPPLVSAMCQSLAEQLRFLERHLELDIGGNHLIKNAKALLWGGSFFDGREAHGWRALGQSLLARELDEQVLADGMHYELSPAYHLQVFADLLESLPLAGSVHETLRSTMTRMVRAVVDLTHPDGKPSLFNDGGLHMAYTPGECIAHARQMGICIPEPRSCFAFREAGYFGLRSDTSYLLVDCGALGPDHLPAHGHGDALAFEWTLAGKRFVVDAGVLEYERGPWRDAARATASHNTVTLDDLDQSEFWAAFRVGRRARVRLERFDESGDGFRLTGSHDGYRSLAGSPRHRRSFDARADRLQVDDEITGGAGQRARARLLLHPEVTVAQVPDGIVLHREGEAVAVESSGAVTVEDAWWFPDFGVKVRTRRMVIDYGPAPCRGSFGLTRRLRD
jgi:uncharacterized heparinase superfamily protein